MVMVISQRAIIFIVIPQIIKYEMDVVIAIEVCAVGGGAARGPGPVPLGESSCLHRVVTSWWFETHSNVRSDHIDEPRIWHDKQAHFLHHDFTFKIMNNIHDDLIDTVACINVDDEVLGVKSWILDSFYRRFCINFLFHG